MMTDGMIPSCHNENNKNNKSAEDELRVAEVLR